MQSMRHYHLGCGERLQTAFQRFNTADKPSREKTEQANEKKRNYNKR